MAKIDIYTKPWCPYCGRATNLLTRMGVSFNEIDISNDPVLENQMRIRSGQATVPQIFIGDEHVGGSDDLLLAERNGHLETLLSSVESELA